MKKITLTIICAIFAIAVLAQAPQGISHQAVIRNAANELVINSPIGIKVSILQGSAEGTVVYSETHLPNSNANGLISFVIGQGAVVSGVLEGINWAAGPYFIKTEADPAGGINYTITGTSQVFSVPYALHAKTAETSNETDPVFSASPANSITTTNINNWNTAFTNRITSANGTAPLTLTISSNQLSGSMPAAGASTNGYLTSADWNTFNNKTSSQWGYSGNNIYYNDGNVGMGTTTPAQKLDVNGNIRLSGGNRSLGTWSNHNLDLTTNSATRITIHRTGNVGIGTNSPTTRLNIHGFDTTATSFRINHPSSNYANGIINGLSISGTEIQSQEFYYTVGNAVIGKISAVNYNTSGSGWYGFEERFKAGLSFFTIHSNNLMERLTITSAGNVGIGTSTPGQLLDVNGNIRLSGDHRSLGTWSAHNLNLTTSSATRMTIASAGNVGIGTTEPTQRLDVNGNIRLSGGNRSLGTWSKNHLNLTTDSLTRMTITSSGNVGIGTSNPGQLLDVNGNIRLSGDHRSLGTWSAHNLNLTTNSTARMTIYSGGRVGIGTTTGPLSPFDVRGYEGNFLAHFYNSHNSGSAGDQSSVYAILGEGQQGAGYGQAVSRAPLKGFAFFGYGYTFGVAGYRYNDPYNRSGGVIGGASQANTPAWGSLGYRCSASILWGGYFTSSLTGFGKRPNEVMINCGIAAWGDLMGATINGKVYGMFVEGENYAIYSNGVNFKNNLDVHLQENGSNTLSILYTNVSDQVTVQTSGIATLSNGKASIMFDPVFAATISNKEPVIVTVTPIGNSNGVYLESVDSRGFAIVENNHGKSNVMVNYIAIGRRAGYENPQLASEVIDAAYTSKIARGIHNDSDTETDGEGLYYENGKLVVGKHPSTMISEPKPNEPHFFENNAMPER